MQNSLNFCETLISDFDKAIAAQSDEGVAKLYVCVREIVVRIKRRIEQDIISIEAEKKERRSA